MIIGMSKPLPVTKHPGGSDWAAWPPVYHVFFVSAMLKTWLMIPSGNEIAIENGAYTVDLPTKNDDFPVRSLKNYQRLEGGHVVTPS